MNARCCGVAGTYGLKAEKYDIAMDGGRRALRADAARARRRSRATARPAAGTSRRPPAARRCTRSISCTAPTGSAGVVGLVVVSHSEALAEGVVALAREMGGEELKLEAAGGMDEPGAMGTDAERVRAAIERAMSDDGVLVLMDLGSALMSAEFAVEMLDGTDRARAAERRPAGGGHRGRGGAARGAAPPWRRSPPRPAARWR